MNIRKVVGEIHAQAKQKNARTGSLGAQESMPPDIANELAILHDAFERLLQMRGLVGGMPPAPATLRGRLGARLVRIVQRMLFWYTPQIHRVQHGVTNTVGSLAKLMETQIETVAELRREVAILRRMQDFGSRTAIRQTSPDRDGRQTEGSAIPPAFEFALQDRFRGPAEDTSRKLEEWLQTIGVSGGRRGDLSLDIGCGRGEWLRMASAAGYTACGIDANPVAVDHCRNLGLCAQVADAFEYLSPKPDESLGLVTLFLVVEHLPPGYLLELLRLIGQKLRPGGLIAIETPNPASLLMAAHYFWNDPTHVRPLPEALLTFMLEYTGFTIVRRAGMNPFPAEEHLPWAELDVVRRLDDLLYGARDYGVLGRK